MVKRAILCATCGLIVALAPMAKAGHGVSYGPHLEVAFDQALARLSVDGSLSLELLRMVMKPINETKTEEYAVTVQVQIEKVDPVTGQKKTEIVEQPETRIRTISVMKLVAVPQTHRISPALVPLFEIDGTAVPPDSLGERLKKPTLVVITHDSKPLPGYYALLFKPGTLVVGGAAPPPTSPSMPGDAKQDDFTLPAGMPQTFRLAEVDEEDRFSLRMLRTTDEAVTGMRTVTETHKTEDGERQVNKLIPVAMTQQLHTSLTIIVPRQHVIAATAEGKPMEEVHLNALRQREYAVVVSRDGKPVDPFWLQNLKPRMLVLVPPVANLAATAPAYAQGQVIAAPPPALAPVVRFTFNGHANSEPPAEAAFDLRNTTFKDDALYLNGIYEFGPQGKEGYHAVCKTPALRFTAFTVTLRFRAESFDREPPRGCLLMGGILYRWFGLERSPAGNLTVTFNNRKLVHEIPAAPLNAGRWTVVSCGVDFAAKKVVAWLDGKPAGGFDLPADFKLEVIGTPQETSDKVKVWSFVNYANTDLFHGLVDELIIHNRLLSPDEVQQELSRIPTQRTAADSTKNQQPATAEFLSKAEHEMPFFPEPRGQTLPAGAAPENDDEPAAGQTSAPPPAAATGDTWIGRSVVPKPGIQLKVTGTNRSLDWRNAGALPWKVTHVKGDWVWIGKTWAKKDQVVRLGDTPRDQQLVKFSESVRKESANMWHYVNRSYFWEPRDVKSTIADLNEALRLDPKNDYVLRTRVETWQRSGDWQAALNGWNELLRIQPKDSQALVGRALILAASPDPKIRNGRQAIADATQACEISGWKDGQSLDALAAAYAETGDFESAVRWKEKANEQIKKVAADQSGVQPSKLDDPKFLQRLETPLALYRQGKPLRLELEALRAPPIF